MLKKYVIILVENMGDRMNKGFTLVELLAVIVILTIIGTVGTATINNYINTSRAKSLDMQYESIEKAAQSYASKHVFDEITPSSTCSLVSDNCCTKMPVDGEECYIALADLINDKLIDELKDPKNGGKISNSTLIKIRYTSNQFVIDVIR